MVVYVIRWKKKKKHLVKSIVETHIITIRTVLEIGCETQIGFKHSVNKA